MLAQQLSYVLGLLLAVVLLTTTARRLRLPYPSLLALGGLAMALIPGLPRWQLEPDLVLLVFLPPLLFGTGWRIPARELAENAQAIAVLATGLVLFTTLGVGLAAHALDPSLPLGAAVVLGAILSPTDPLAASAVARQVRLPRRNITLLEGESLANDATGLVVYRIAVGAVLTGAFSVLGGAYSFLVVAVGGVAVGLAVGFVSVQLQRTVDDPPVEFALQLMTGYAAYLPAERFGFSGVFAAATAGLLCGHFWSYTLGARSRLQAVAVWDTLDFLLNAVLFLLLGLQLPVVLAQTGTRDLGHLVLTGLAVSLLAIALRMGWMFAVEWLPRLASRNRPAPAALLPPAPPPAATLASGPALAPAPAPASGPAPAPATTPASAPGLAPNVVALLGWSGMRGVLSLAMALAIPQTTASGAAFPGRPVILFYAFCTIVVTLVVQGLPLPLIIRWLKIPRDEVQHDEERLARLHTARAARDRLEQLHRDGDELTRTLVDELRTHYRRQVDDLEGSPGAVSRSQTETARIRRALAHAQRQALLDLHGRGLVDNQTFRRLERELDLEESA